MSVQQFRIYSCVQHSVHLCTAEAECTVLYSRVFSCRQQSLQFCTAECSVAHSRVHSDQTGTKQGPSIQGPNRKKFRFDQDGQTDRAQVQVLASCAFAAKNGWKISQYCQSFLKQMVAELKESAITLCPDTSCVQTDLEIIIINIIMGPLKFVTSALIQPRIKLDIKDF